MPYAQYETECGFAEPLVVSVANGATPISLTASLPPSWQHGLITEVDIQAASDIYVGYTDTGAKKVSTAAPHYGILIPANTPRTFPWGGNLNHLYAVHGEGAAVNVELIPSVGIPYYKTREK